jgi:predicted ATPase
MPPDQGPAPRGWSPAQPEAEASGVMSQFDRIVFVPLVDCVSAEQALQSMCDAFRSTGSSDSTGDPHQRLLANLEGQRCLLVLDNLEQLASDYAARLAQLLQQLPTLHELATSRRLLGVDGEQAFALRGLPLPPSDALLADAADNPAVALFVDRAQAARSDFHLSARHLPAVLQLVHLLGGSPLAIELIASRLRGNSPQGLLQRLSTQTTTPMLDLLQRPSQRSNAEARHASMREVVAWSWQQLTPEQQLLLGALSVFTSPAPLAAAAAAAGMSAALTEVGIEALADASLVQLVQAEAPSLHGTQTGQGAETADEAEHRLLLLQPVREFVSAQAPPGLAQQARQRVRQWLLQALPPRLARGHVHLAPDMAHVQAAITSAPADAAHRQALQLAVALRPFWESDPPPLSCLLALQQAASHINAEPLDGADQALLADGHELLAFGMGCAGLTQQAQAHAEAGLAASTTDARRHSLALVRWAWATYYAGQHGPKLEAAVAQALVLADQVQDQATQATVLRMQALLACNLHLDFAGAERLLAQAQTLWEQLGNRRQVYDTLFSRATMWAWQGRNEDALRVLQACEQVALTEANWTGLLRVRWQIGRVCIRMRRWAEAQAAFEGSVRTSWQRHHVQGLAAGLLHLPEALVMQGQAVRAARLQGFAVTNWLRLHHTINRIEARELRRTRLLLHLHLGASRSELLRSEGSAMLLADAVSMALDLDQGLAA